MKKVIVIGATGNLGAYSSMRLKEDGYEVIAVGGRKCDNGFFEKQGIQYYSVDIRDKNAFDILPRGNIDAVVHFAGELPSRYHYDPQALIETITLGTLNVLEYMRKVNCLKIIFPQTPFDLSQYHNTDTPTPADERRDFPLTGDHAIYTIAKNSAVDLIEHYHAEFGISRFILRFFTIYQYHPNAYHYSNYQRRMMPYRMLMDRAAKGLPIEIWGDPTRAKEMVYIKDFVRLVSLCVNSNIEGGVYNVGNGWQVSLEEQIRGIIDVFSPKEKPSPVIYCPEKPEALKSAFDISKTIKDLKFKPEYSYLDQLKDIKHEMEVEPFALLWGTKEDYQE